ncbi:MAG TPA: nucleotide sugar dehydrogenase [Pyrinomonadaceae bacterium]|jgi:UDP-N-acetyl-D-mannosaminuronate dehydrogenase/intein/homing endonuclease
MTTTKDTLLELIRERRAHVGVIGLGYVGLPLLVEFAAAGFRGTGFEVDEAKAARVNGGDSYIPDVTAERVRALVTEGRLDATTDFTRLDACDAIIICVPTPLRKTKEPDISYILAAAEQIQRALRRGQLVILESTTYPGTTDEVLLPMFEEKGLKLDADFLLAFSPERVDPGNPQFQTHNIPKVVGGCTDDSTAAAAALYASIVNHVHPVSSARVAEAAKLLENTFRAVNIGMANEMARLCYALGIDTWEVIRAAATKPFGFMPFYPGPGIGGHCLVGSETVVVRASDEGGEQLQPLATLFAEQLAAPRVRKFEAGGGDVIYRPRLQALSLDTETQLPVWKPVRYLFRRKTEGATVTVTTSDNRRVTVTDKHPMLVSDEAGRLRQVFARDLTVGDRLPIHRLPAPVMGGATGEIESPQLDLLPLLPPALVAKTRVRLVGGSWGDFRAALRSRLSSAAAQEFIRQNYLPLADFLALERAGALALAHESLRLYTGRGPSATSCPAVLKLTPGFARLLGYYLAEGCATNEHGRERVRFSFHRAETEYVADVRGLLQTELGINSSVSHARVDQVTHVRVASTLFGWVLVAALGCGRRSTEMRIPAVLLNASPPHRRELLKGLLRGDGDVYVKTGVQSYERNGRTYSHHSASAEVGYFSSSPVLFQQVAYLLQGLGFTPTFKRAKPHLQLKGREQLAQLRHWLGPKGARLERYFAASRRAPASKTFKQAGCLTTVPVKAIEIKRPDGPVEVYSVEVDDTHTFATSYGIYVHNCIPLDPHYLSWKARQHGFDSRFIGLAEEVNSRMPEHVVQLVADGLNDEMKALKGARVLLLGVAYKKDIDDVRESPALSIIDRLRAKGAQVRYHDPFVAEVRFDDAHTEGSGAPLQSVALADEELTAADCVVIVTDHSQVDYRRVCELSRLVVDTRNALSPDLRRTSCARIVRL